MKKYFRIAGLIVFWVSTFALVTTLLRWKQRLELPGMKSGTNVASTSLDGAGLGAGGGARPTGGQPSRGGGGAAAEGGEGEADGSRDAVAVGQALFDLPAPFQAGDISDLMTELHATRDELDKRGAALDLREQELQVLEQELETRRIDLLQMARNLGSSAGNQDDFEEDVNDAIPADPASYRRIATILAGMKDKEQAKRALLAKDRDEAAQLLLTMKEKDAAAILALFPEDALKEVTSAMLRLERQR